MVKLPHPSGFEVAKVLAKIGYEIEETRPHYIAIVGKKRIAIPRHKELYLGTLRSIMREVGLSREEFIKLLKNS